MRAFLGIVAGIVAGFAAMFVIAYIGGMIFPATTRIDAITAEQVTAAFTSLPLGAKIAIIASWFGGALAGAALAKYISSLAWVAWTAGGFFVAYVILTVLILPMPGWLQVTAVLAPLLGALIANHLVGTAAVATTATDPAD